MPGERLLRHICARQFEELGPLRRRVLSLLPLSRCATILDAGCGTGLLLEELSGLTEARLLGIDADPALLLEAAARCDSGRCDLREADLESSRLPDCDLVVSSHILGFLRHPGGFLRRARRALRPDGLYGVLCEYDLCAVRCEGNPRLPPLLLEALVARGMQPGNTSRMDELFERAGFSRVHGGIETQRPRAPAPEFLEELGLDEGEWGSRMIVWPVRWGIYSAG
ncbi:methyltransferase domain-containing protein [Candidatus Fermentibacterales bacterium]|nr:methyltransferase domain-containing protein [Candidatus Fermentibacterales bacterium]